MKGVLLAGGSGSRLMPLTKVTNKHLIPVYNKPMIMYPMQKLVNAGIKDVLIITSPDYSGHFLSLLGSGSDLGINISYKIQNEAAGIAHAIGLAENFAGNENICVILGDNIFEDELDLSNFKDGARIHLKAVEDANRFGVAEVDGRKVIRIVEKPKAPKSNYAVTGLYFYDRDVFDIIKTLKPSARGELEITDVNNAYIKKGKMEFKILNGFWSDAGTFESLHRSSEFVKENSKKD